MSRAIPKRGIKTPREGKVTQVYQNIIEGAGGHPKWASSGHLRGCSMADTTTKSMSSGMYPSIIVTNVNPLVPNGAFSPLLQCKAESEANILWTRVRTSEDKCKKKAEEEEEAEDAPSSSKDDEYDEDEYRIFVDKLECLE